MISRVGPMAGKPESRFGMEPSTEAQAPVMKIEIEVTARLPA